MVINDELIVIINNNPNATIRNDIDNKMCPARTNFNPDEIHCHQNMVRRRSCPISQNPI